MSNLCVYSTDERKSKIVHINDFESKRVNVNVCSTDKIEPKSVHKMDIIMNTNKVKDTKDEEPLVTDNSNIEVIKAPGYFKLFECGKMFFNNLDLMYKHACMENAKEKYCCKFMIP